MRRKNHRLDWTGQTDQPPAPVPGPGPALPYPPSSGSPAPTPGPPAAPRPREERRRARRSARPPRLERWACWGPLWLPLLPAGAPPPGSLGCWLRPVCGNWDFRSPRFARVGRPLRAPGEGRAPDGAMPQLSNPTPGPPPRGSARSPAPDRPQRRPDPSVARLGAVGGSQLFAEARSPIRDLGDVGLEVWGFGGVPPSPGQRMTRMGARTVSAGSTYPPRPAQPQSLQNPITKTPSTRG